MKFRRHGGGTYFILLLLMQCLTGCSQNKYMQTENKQIRILALGDSYTIGESVDPSDRWVMQLASDLRRKKLQVAEPLIIARTGWTTDDLSKAIDIQKPDSNYDLAFLLIGVNNQYQDKSSEEYRKEFVALLQQAIIFASGEKENVFVISIPDWGVTPFAAGRDREKIAKEIDQFNSINKAESIIAGVNYTDITAGSKRAAEDPGLLADDGLHPSGRMYREWADALLPDVMKAIGKR